MATPEMTQANGTENGVKAVVLNAKLSPAMRSIVDDVAGSQDISRAAVLRRALAAYCRSELAGLDLLTEDATKALAELEDGGDDE